MAANTHREYRTFRYYEGTCSVADFPKELARVLALGVKTKPITDSDGNVLQTAEVLKACNWDIAYPTPSKSLGLELEGLTDEEYWKKIDNLTVDEYVKKINDQVSKITDTVILRTTTTPKKEGEFEIDDLSVDPDTNEAKVSMYLEIFMPKYLANPEEYPIDCERKGITPRVITKEMYEEALKRNKSEIENIYDDSEVAPSTKEIIDIDSAELYMTYAQLSGYCDHIYSVYNSTDILPIPNDSSASSVSELLITKEYLGKIKNQDSVLFNLITSMLHISDDEYTLLKSITVHIARMEVLNSTSLQYAFALLADKQVDVYHIAADSVYTLKEGRVATERLRPELYLNGTYISLPRDYYTSTTNMITFKKDFDFCDEEYQDAFRGSLVVRFKYEKNKSEIVKSLKDIDISERAVLNNYHYMLLRMFDNISDDKSAPLANVTDKDGNILVMNSHISPWTKLSWYRDFYEIMIDEMDEDDNTNQISEGTVLIPLETPGINGDTKLRYWINTNNDRYSLVVMGNPSFDYEMERHAISMSYSGRIDSFENSINDVSGNFALCGSSTTEPCYTKLYNDVDDHPMKRYEPEDLNADNPEIFEDFKANCQEIGGVLDCNGSNQFYISLPANTFFNEDRWPYYMIIDSVDNALVNYEPVDVAIFTKRRNTDKSSELEIRLEKAATFNAPNKIYVNFGFYKHKYVITSGVTRDVFGNVVKVRKDETYGLNTSDGVTSIMMFHTRSKAFYQKHHMLFATTEEYMSKVMYGKSAYTGEYYADRIKVTHGNDGPRGIMSDILVIDSSSLYPQDELVVNKDFQNDPDELEETFIYFPITAFYSPLSDSPNARYGIAIKKLEREPKYEDEEKLLDIAEAEVNTKMKNVRNTDKDIVLLSKSENGCDVYWDVIENTSWYEKESNLVKFQPLQLAIANTSEYEGDISTPIYPDTGASISVGTTVPTVDVRDIESYIKVDSFAGSSSATKIMFGVSNSEVTELPTDAELIAYVDDNTNPPESDNMHIYNIAGKPVDFSGDANTFLNVNSISSSTEVKIKNATPDKYLMMYAVKETTTTAGPTYQVKGFACVPMKEIAPNVSPYALLRCPCKVFVAITQGGGRNSKVVDLETGTQDSYITKTIDYNGTFNVAVNPAAGWVIDKIVVSYPNIVDASGVTIRDEFSGTSIVSGVGGSTFKGISISNVNDDIRVEVMFKRA